MIPDPLLAVKAYLLADADVAALLGTRIWGEEVPASEVNAMPRHGLVIVHAGGRELFGGTRMDIGGMRISTRAYGPTYYDAQILDRAVYEAFKALHRYGATGQAGLYSVTQESGPFTQRDPSTDWPYALCTYVAMVGEVANA